MTDTTPQYDRRERYAAAMAAVHGADPEWIFEWNPEADAVMVMADKEQQDLRAEINRLRTELATARAKAFREAADELVKKYGVTNRAASDLKRMASEAGAQ